MILPHQQGGWIVLISFLIAFILNSIPLPTLADHFRPDWLSMTLIYWCMAVPHRVGIGTGFVLGLMLDGAQGTLLGQHAIAFAVVAYIALKTHRRVRVFPLWQQAISVLFIILAKQLLVYWINGIVGYPPWDLWYLATALGSMVFWPWVFVILRDLRRYFQVA